MNKRYHVPVGTHLLEEKEDELLEIARTSHEQLQQAGGNEESAAVRALKRNLTDLFHTMGEHDFEQFKEVFGIRPDDNGEDLSRTMPTMVEFVQRFINDQEITDSGRCANPVSPLHI